MLPRPEVAAALPKGDGEAVNGAGFLLLPSGAERGADVSVEGGIVCRAAEGLPAVFAFAVITMRGDAAHGIGSAVIMLAGVIVTDAVFFAVKWQIGTEIRCFFRLRRRAGGKAEGEQERDEVFAHGSEVVATPYFRVDGLLAFAFVPEATACRASIFFRLFIGGGGIFAVVGEGVAVFNHLQVDVAAVHKQGAKAALVVVGAKIVHIEVLPETLAELAFGFFAEGFLPHFRRVDTGKADADFLLAFLPVAAGGDGVAVVDFFQCTAVGLAILSVKDVMTAAVVAATFFMWPSGEGEHDDTAQNQNDEFVEGLLATQEGCEQRREAALLLFV